MQMRRVCMNGLDLIGIEVGSDEISRARQIRAERDRRYANLYLEEETDWRWVGDLGELCVGAWFADEDIPYLWVAGDDVAGLSDFLVAGWRIGVKTVKRKVDVRPNYTAQITDRHKSEKSDGYAFLSFNTQTQIMWMLGTIGRLRFLRQSRFYGEGASVHNSYKIRQGHAIRNIEISKLTPPSQWIDMLRQRLDTLNTGQKGNFIPGLEGKNNPLGA
jgi:hypothetical protein